MTTTYDASHPMYFDESDVRNEMTRVFEVCHQCRACVSLCGVFPTLFAFVDAHPDQDPGWMTPVEQDRVADECVHCGECSLICPYLPDRHEWAINVPALVSRNSAMRVGPRRWAWRRRVSALLGRVMGRFDRV